MAETLPFPSSLFNTGDIAHENDLAILHLQRENLIPTVLTPHDENDEGYAEGKVTNTRFGSFPHTTLIGLPWGSQVRASMVDTGSRGRRDLKRKRKGSEEGRGGLHNSVDEDSHAQEMGKKGKAAIQAQTGFVHLLPPTPERWTESLPHRTQVVYTPDYSYVLHRMKVRPGDRIIEAGAGSGSFTHAAARAVFNGYPAEDGDQQLHGKVYSFEFHQPRAERLQGEIEEHGLGGVVELTGRDVCNDGFALSTNPTSPMNVNAIFLDLPAPWLALRHLNHDIGNSPLNSNAAVHLCTFSPCIEQVQRTTTTLRQLGWVEIEMVEMAAKRVEIRRERIGIHEEGLRGANDNPASVDEALSRLLEQETRQMLYHKGSADEAPLKGSGASKKEIKVKASTKVAPQGEQRKLYKEGKLVTRSEPELKAHTSYLVFAVLPRRWTDEDEEIARAKWPEKVEVPEPNGPLGKKAKRKAEIAARKAASTE